MHDFTCNLFECAHNNYYVNNKQKHRSDCSLCIRRTDLHLLLVSDRDASAHPNTPMYFIPPCIPLLYSKIKVNIIKQRLWVLVRIYVLPKNMKSTFYSTLLHIVRHSDQGLSCLQTYGIYFHIWLMCAFFNFKTKYVRQDFEDKVTLSEY